MRTDITISTQYSPILHSVVNFLVEPLNVNKEANGPRVSSD